MSQIQIIKVTSGRGPPGPPGPVGPGIQLGAIAGGDDFTFSDTDFARYIDATAGNVTGTLPPATGSGRLYIAVKIDSTSNV